MKKNLMWVAVALMTAMITTGCSKSDDEATTEELKMPEVIMPDEPLPIEEISQDMVHRYLSFEDFSIVEDGGKYYIEDETGRLQIFDKFGLFPDGFDMGATYAEGFLTIYRGELELYPIEVGDGGMDCGTKGDVNQDGVVDISDIVAIINHIAGTAEWPLSDVNEDGTTDISDIVKVINLMAGQTEASE